MSIGFESEQASDLTAELVLAMLSRTKAAKVMADETAERLGAHLMGLRKELAKIVPDGTERTIRLREGGKLHIKAIGGTGLTLLTYLNDDGSPDREKGAFYA